MPSVGMRRITRVFGARVLRSGRRMLTEPHKEWKYIRAPNGGHDSVALLENSDNVKNVGLNNEKHATTDAVNVGPTSEENDTNTISVMVYRRKRKRNESMTDVLPEDKRFGKKFARRNLRKELSGNLKLRRNDKIKKTRCSLRRKKGSETLASEFFKIRHGGARSAAEPNLRDPPISVIPVPMVKEVHVCPVDSNYSKFVRPDVYINVEDDELSRALVKKTANYDMDSDDEKWLNELNDEFHVTPEVFELVIDALEKGFHCNPDDYCSEEKKREYVSCMHLEKKEVVEAICDYWISKRKQKRAPLVRIFQLYPPRKTQVIPDCIVRKKRSFKRLSSPGRRGKQRTFMQASSAEREAKAVAHKSEELCVVKRERAQMLMENADLATYKAMMALKIAEAADSPGTIASFSLG